MSITGAFIAAAIILLRIPMKKLPKKYSYALWAILGIRLLCPFSFSSAISLFNIFRPKTSDNHMEYITSVPYVPPAEEAFSGFTEAGQEFTMDPIQGIPEVPVETTVNPGEILACAAAALWIAGILFLIILNAVSYVRVKKSVKGALRLRDNIYVCKEIGTPFVCGILKPKIYIPESVSEPDSEYIIAHEKTHIGRGDHIVKLIAAAALALHWFNPLVWISYKLMTRDMELSCDEKALAGFDGDVRREYANALLNISVRQNNISLGGVLSFGESSVKARIKGVLSAKKPTVIVTAAAVAAVIAAALCLLTNAKETLIDKSEFSSFTIAEQTDWAPDSEISVLGAEEIINYVNKSRYRKLSPEEAVTAEIMGETTYALRMYYSGDCTGDCKSLWIYTPAGYKSRKIHIFCISDGSEKSFYSLDEEQWLELAEKMTASFEGISGEYKSEDGAYTLKFLHRDRIAGFSLCEGVAGELFITGGGCSHDINNMILRSEIYDPETEETVSFIFSYLGGGTVLFLTEDGKPYGNYPVYYINENQPVRSLHEEDNSVSPEADAGISSDYGASDPVTAVKNYFALELESNPGITSNEIFVIAEKENMTADIREALRNSRGEARYDLSGSEINTVRAVYALVNTVYDGNYSELYEKCFYTVKYSDNKYRILDSSENEVISPYIPYDHYSNAEVVTAAANYSEVSRDPAVSSSAVNFLEDPQEAERKLTESSLIEAWNTRFDTSTLKAVRMGWFIGDAGSEIQLYYYLVRDNDQSDRYIVIAREFIAESAEKVFNVEFPRNEGSAEHFTVSLALPRGWTVRDYREGDMLSGAALMSPVSVCDETGEVVGSMGYNSFEIYDGTTDENFYRMVYNQLMLGSVVQWDGGYTPVKSDSHSETAMTKVIIHSGGAGGTTEEYPALLHYDTERLVYIGFRFKEGAFTESELNNLAQRITFSDVPERKSSSVEHSGGYYFSVPFSEKLPESPEGILIGSKKELDSFIEKYLNGHEMAENILERYGEDFFGESCLAAAVFYSPSGSERYAVRSVSEKNGVLEIRLNNTEPNLWYGTSDVQCTAYVISLPKQEGIASVKAVITDGEAVIGHEETDLFRKYLGWYWNEMADTGIHSFDPETSFSDENMLEYARAEQEDFDGNVVFHGVSRLDVYPYETMTVKGAKSDGRMWYIVPYSVEYMDENYAMSYGEAGYRAYFELKEVNGELKIHRALTFMTSAEEEATGISSPEEASAREYIDVSKAAGTIKPNDGSPVSWEQTNEPLLKAADNDWGITMTAENISPAGLTAVFSRSGGKPVGEYMTGSSYTVERYDGSGWEELEYIPSEYERGFDDIGIIIKDNESLLLECSWGWLYGELPPGHYRIVKQIQTGAGATLTTRNYYAEFDIEDNL